MLPALVVAAAVMAAAASGCAAQVRAAEASREAPAGPLGAAETFVVTRFEFTGHTALTTTELEALAAPFLNRPIRAIELEELRQRISRVYVERGFVSSGALIEGDASRAGTLAIRIVEGVVSEVRTRGMERLADNYVAARLTRPGEPLNVGVLQERYRLLLADPLFERINARLLPGAALGSSILDVEVERALPYRLTLFAHNHQAPAVGSAQAGVEGQVHNLTGWGDQIAATLAKSRGSDNADVNWTLPIAAGRTFAGLHLARGNSSVIEEPVAALGIESRVKTYELTLGHPLLESARRKLVLGATFSQRSNRTTLDGEPFSFVPGEATGTAEVKAWRFFQDWVVRFDRHVLALRSTFVAGRNNLVADDTVPGQPGTHYHLWQGQAQSAIDLGEGGAQLLLRAQVQVSEDRLVPLEQMSLGGRYTVRGYRENQLVRDGGYAFGAEYRQPLLRGDAALGTLVLVPFVDFGAAGNRGAERKRLASAGLGLKWSVADYEAELFWAKRLESRPVATQGDLQDHGIHFSLRWRAF